MSSTSKSFCSVGALVVVLLFYTPARGEVPYVNLGAAAVHFDMVADSAGTLHVIWKPPVGAYRYGVLQGETLTEINTIPNSNLVIRKRSKPRLAVQNAGEAVHVLWASSGSTILTHAIYDGAAWSTQALWSGAPNHRWDPMLAVCPDGALHTIAQKGVAEPFDQIVYSYKPAGGAWQNEVVLYDDLNDKETRDTFISCDSAGNVNAGWTRNAAYAPAGSPLTTSSALPKPAGVVSLCCGDMTVDTDGGVHYALKAFRPGQLEEIAYTYKPAGGEWEVPEVGFSGNDLECYPVEPDYEVWPAVSVGDDGRVFIAWAYSDCVSDYAPTVELAVRDLDGTWQTTQLDDDAAIHRSHAKPTLAKADGFVNILWTVPGANGPELVLHRIDTSVEDPPLVVPNTIVRAPAVAQTDGPAVEPEEIQETEHEPANGGCSIAASKGGSGGLLLFGLFAFVLCRLWRRRSGQCG